MVDGQYVCLASGGSSGVRGLFVQTLRSNRPSATRHIHVLTFNNTGLITVWGSRTRPLFLTWVSMRLARIR